MNSEAAHTLAARIGALEALDGPARAIAAKVRALLPAGGGVKDVLSGTPLGHPLHPLLTDVPVGTWTSATILDVAGGRAARPAARRLIGVGLLAALPTALSGWTDWADAEPADDGVRRMGMAHALGNGVTAGLYGASLLARRRGAHATGIALGLAGMATLTASAWLGGELAYARGVGVDQTAFAGAPEDWTPVLDASMLADDRPTPATAAGLELVLVRRDGRVHALADRCSHRGGRLHEGELEGGCIVCPLHGSRFRLADGALERGPSAYPQPALEARISDGRVEVRAARTGA